MTDKKKTEEKKTRDVWKEAPAKKKEKPAVSEEKKAAARKRGVRHGR